MNQDTIRLNLRLFDGGEGAGTGEGGSDAGNERANGTERVVYGIQPPETDAPADPPDAAEETTSDAQPEAPADTPSKEDKAAAFEKLIREEYKKEFAARTQSIIDKRFKETKRLEEQLGEATPILDMLAQRYGVAAGDLQKLAAAVEEDDSYFEEEAARKGLSVEQLRQLKRMERENESMRRSLQEMERRTDAERVYAGWLEQGEKLKEIYPDFDLRQECADERFVDLLRSNIDVRTAYEVVHRDEVLGGAMQYAARQVSEKLVGNIRAKGLRPTENGVSSGSAVVVKSDVNALTKKDREEIERRVARGERISF